MGSGHFTTCTATGTSVVRHAELPSTNAQAMRLAASGERGPLWIVAATQSAGRGRSNREWVSPEGNLYASYILTTSAPLAVAHQLSLVAGVALFDALGAAGITRDHGLRLKWPNDILIGRAKAGGILVESSNLPGSDRFTAVIGIGINLISHPVIPDRETTNLQVLGSELTPEIMLDILDPSLTSALRMWDAGKGFVEVRESWLHRAGAIGEAISVHTGDRQLSGSFGGLDVDGALLLDLQGGERLRCTYGDVSIG